MLTIQSSIPPCLATINEDPVVLKYVPHPNDNSFDFTYSFGPDNKMYVTLSELTIKPPRSTINVTYFLIDKSPATARYICDNINSKEKDLVTKMKINENDLELNQRVCLSSLYMFSLQNRADDSTNLTRYCRKREVLVDYDEYKKKQKIEINDLLPSQPYLFIVSLRSGYKAGLDTVVFGHLYRSVCRPEYRPVRPPQADFGSFVRLHKGDSENASSTYRLYWRLVPRELLGSFNTSYFIYFEAENAWDRSESSISSSNGYFDYNKTTKGDIKARIFAESNAGLSQHSSYIMIPQDSNFIDMEGRFKLYVVSINPNRYLLRWTPIAEEIRAKRTATTNTNSTQLVIEFYTVYWCFGDPHNDCKSLAGLKRVQTNSYELAIETMLNEGTIKFGVSYHRSDGLDALSTGIIWSECVAYKTTSMLSRELNIWKNPKNNVKDEDEFTSLTISVSLKICDSFKAYIETYQFEYCLIDKVSGYAIIFRNPSKGQFTQYSQNGMQKFENYFKDCKRVDISNSVDIFDDIRIDNLEPSSSYAIRARYFKEGKSNPWSQGIFVSTPIDQTTRFYQMLKASAYLIMIVKVLTSLYKYCSPPRSEGLQLFLELFDRSRQVELDFSFLDDSDDGSSSGSDQGNSSDSSEEYGNQDSESYDLDSQSDSAPTSNISLCQENPQSDGKSEADSEEPREEFIEEADENLRKEIRNESVELNPLRGSKP